MQYYSGMDIFMIKRIISILISAAILLSTYGSCLATDTGGAPSSWAKKAVNRAIENKFIPDRLQKDYQKQITREEFASLLVQTIFACQWIRVGSEYRTEDDFSYYCQDTIVTRESVLKQVKVLDFNFKDTQSEDVKLAYIMGLVSGTSDTTFEPDKLLTRQDAAVMLSNYGGPEGGAISTATDFKRYLSRYTDLNKASAWARDAMNLAFLRYIINGDASKADREWDCKKKITLDPLGKLTREQAIVMLDNIAFYEENTGYLPFYFSVVYLRGCVPYLGDFMGVNWEISRNSVKAVSLNDALKEAIKYTPCASRELERNYSWIYEGQARKVSCEAHIASVPRISMFTQFFTSEQGKLIATGKNVAFDIGFAVYEANNPDYVFEYRFKNNGFITAGYYGGGKLIEIESKQIK